MYRLICFTCFVCLMISCENGPEFKNSLLEAEINGQIYSFTGTAKRYTDYINGVKSGYEYNIFNVDKQSFFIEAYDSTFVKICFTFPDTKLRYIIDLPGGSSKTHDSTEGQFRILEDDEGILRGDFSFKVKNIADPLDSVMITNGYFDIKLEKSDRSFP